MYGVGHLPGAPQVRPNSALHAYDPAGDASLFLSHALRLDDYHDGYLPAVSYLKEHASRETPINGSPGLLFALPDYRLISDSRLHDSAEYVVVDRWYRFDWGFVYRNYEPQTAVEVQRKLEMYEPVWERGGWTILHRRRAGI